MKIAVAECGQPELTRRERLGCAEEWRIQNAVGCAAIDDVEVLDIAPNVGISRLQILTLDIVEQLVTAKKPLSTTIGFQPNWDTRFPGSAVAPIQLAKHLRTRDHRDP